MRFQTSVPPQHPDDLICKEASLGTGRQCDESEHGWFEKANDAGASDAELVGLI